MKKLTKKHEAHATHHRVHHKLHHKKKRAFTLIELLAVVVIFAIIAVIAVPTIISVVKKSRQDVYKKNEQMLVTAARDYIGGSPGVAPTNVGDSNVISMADLSGVALIKKIKDPVTADITCDGYVVVRKEAEGTYSYNPYLKCGTNYETVLYNEGGAIPSLRPPFMKTYGGSDGDYFNGVTTLDDGYLAVGQSISSNGDQTGVFFGWGGDDALIVKYDIHGNIVWKKNYGVGGDDHFLAVTKDTDGYVAVGNGSSYDGIFTGMDHGISFDAYIVKYDTAGNILWRKNFGGTGLDYFNSIATTSDGYVAVGYSNSNDGDLAGMNKGGTDAIVVKYDKSGNVVWKKAFGGTQSDLFFGISIVDNNYIVSGYSNSNDGDLTGLNKGNYDGVIVKYDSDGNIIWNKNFGGSNFDKFSGVRTDGSTIAVVGYSNSNDGDLSGLNKGNYDAIIAQFDLNGNLQWNKNFGGSSEEQYADICATAGGYIAVGQTNSTNGDIVGKMNGNGTADAIMTKYDGNGNMIWKKVYGGSGVDVFSSVTIADNGVSVVGTSNSNDYDLVGLNKGSMDAIIFNLQ